VEVPHPSLLPRLSGCQEIFKFGEELGHLYR
jgi:hypothetical protein